MYHKILLFILTVCLTSNLLAQSKDIKDEQALEPFLLFTNKQAQPSTHQQNPLTEQVAYYAVKGQLPDSVHVHRSLSEDLHIISFLSEQIKNKIPAHQIIPVNNRWKLSPELLSVINEAVHPVTQQVSAFINVSDADALVKNHPDNLDFQLLGNHASSGNMQILTNYSWLFNQALQDPNIQFIALAKKPYTERELTGFDISVNKINLAHLLWPTINGQGLTVSIKENKMDTLDIDFKGRYRYSPTASGLMQTHATTMATMAAGGGNTDYTGKGIAWGANISSSNFANLLPDNIAELKSLQVAVQNHSYGVGIENYYGADAAAYDAQVMQNPYLLHVFSAGNAGNLSSNTGIYQGINGFANLTGSFKMAKNILTVGAIDSFYQPMGISSRGPAFDGRVKPELVALGEDGSSGAAAIVSGMGLLVRNAYETKFLGAKAIEASLIKAILLNSADDIGTKGIDYATGYGNANAWRALQTIAENKILGGTIQNGNSNTHNISLPANARNLKITICWNDPPAQPNTFKALVNDLDLELVHNNTAQKWLPWVLNSFPNADSLAKPATRQRDSLNNAEQISVDLPPAGDYQILVKGSNRNLTDQAYHIAWQYDTSEHFIFTYPVKGDHLLPANTHAIRWENTLTGTPTLQYRTRLTDWQTITSNLDLSKKYYQWVTPDQTTTIQFRLLNGLKEWQSDTVSLSPRLRINTGFNCVDSFLVYWQKAGVNSYQVYRLGSQYLEPFKVVTDTAFIQTKQNNPYEYFTVAPILPFQIEGIKSYTFNYKQQQVDCYINGFFADPSGTKNARLTLQLGTLFGVAKIVFEKRTATGFTDIKTLTSFNNKEIITLEAATGGLNSYRARVELLNGQVYYTQTESVYIFDGQSFYLFPNPLRPGASLRLLADDFDDTVIRLYDVLGRKVAEQKIDQYLNEIKLPLLQSGIYYAILYKSGNRILSQTIIVQ